LHFYESGAMTYSPLELALIEAFAMYNAFTRRTVRVALSQTVLKKLVYLYEQGYTMVLAIIIEAYNLVAADKRTSMYHTSSVIIRLSGVEMHFVVTSQLTDGHFEVTTISDNPQQQ
jgi:hypothetical protein